MKPVSVAVLQVKNETIADLREVSFGGLLQRAVIGAETYDISALLKVSIEEALAEHGYTLALAREPLGFDPRKPFPEGTPAPSYQAILLTTIDSWHADTTSSFASFTMRYRIEMLRVIGAETLFSGEFTCDHQEVRGPQSAASVPGAIRRSTRRALATLPPASP